MVQLPTPAVLRPAANLLLGALPMQDYQRILRHLVPVVLEPGAIIAEPGERASHVYFPVTGVLSLLTMLEGGISDEVAMVGSEGLVGIASFMEGEYGSGPRYRVAVTDAGHAFRMPVHELALEFARAGTLRPWLLRYTQALMVQIAQVAVCNRRHRLEEQLCRWLLLRLDRLAGNELMSSHQQISQLLGVRREGVTVAAGHLQDAGLVRCRPGRMVVLDRPGLELRVCECYGVIRREYARLLGTSVPDGRQTHLPARHRAAGAIGAAYAVKQESGG